MGKANKFIAAALSSVLLLIWLYKAVYGLNPENIQKKPYIVFDPMAESAYDLCDDARDMVKDSIVLYLGNPFALINGSPGRVRVNNPQAVPIIDNNEVYVPAAFITEALGARASWFPDTGAMVISAGRYTISFITGENRVSINGTQSYLPFPTFFKNEEAYIHLSSICEVFGRRVCCFGNMVMVSPIDKVADLNEDSHIVNDLLHYFSGGKLSPGSAMLRESAVPVNVSQPIEGRNIRVYMNEDELNLYAFPITEIDPDASAHDHSLILQDNVIMAPVVLLRLLDIDVFENVKRDAISLLEAAPFGNYTSLALKPDTDHGYLNIPGADPFSNEDAFKGRLIVLPAAPKLMNNHLYIPILEVIRLFGINADWNQKSYTLRIRTMGAPRFPNLRWTARIIQDMKTRYKLTTTIRKKGSDGKDLLKVDCASSGYYDSGEYSSQAAVTALSQGSAISDSTAQYEVSRCLNKDFEFEYFVKDLRHQTSEVRPIATLSCCELLMTDIEYLRRKTELLTSHFYASELLRKQTDVSINGRVADKYSIELNDSSLITELFGIRKPPETDSRKSKISNTEVYIPDYLRMELSIDKKGQVANCSINYSGKIRKERQLASQYFEVSVYADFY